MIDVFISTLRELCPSTGEPEDIALELHPVLYGFLDRQALIGTVRKRNIVPTFRPRERSNVSLRRWYQAVQLLLLRWAVPLSVIHALARKFHRSVLILARGVIREAVRAWLELLHRRNKVTGAALLFRMVRLDADRQGGAIGALGDLQGNAVPLAETALLPRPEDVEEDAHADHDAYGHRASSLAIRRTPLHGHGLP